MPPLCCDAFHYILMTDFVSPKFLVLKGNSVGRFPNWLPLKWCLWSSHTHQHTVLSEPFILPAREGTVRALGWHHWHLISRSSCTMLTYIRFPFRFSILRHHECLSYALAKQQWSPTIWAPRTHRTVSMHPGIPSTVTREAEATCGVVLLGNENDSFLSVIKPGICSSK